ncbi:MAG: NTP transferase domain-containing protein, partial [Chloroflexi bacterium]|nr:NTP transferase domain-containing protein [Chloroflexota bacterium]
MNAAVLLAAGESTRMGRPKQLLDWHGRALVVAQIETLLSAGGIFWRVMNTSSDPDNSP